MSTSHTSYDADLHDNQIVAMYDTAAEATTAAQVLQANGFPAACMRVLAQGKVLDGLAPHTPAQPESQSIWSAIASLFVPHDERTTFQSVIARGHAMLVVTPDRTVDRPHLIHLLEDTHPVDLDARQAEWLEAGQPLDLGYRNAAETSEGSPAAEAAEARYRDAHREMPEGATRVRSYIAPRSTEHSVAASAAEPEMPSRIPTSTDSAL